MPVHALVRRALSVVVVFVVLSASGYAQTASSASTARQLLDAMVKALGGTQFLDVKEIRTSGRYFQFNRGQLSNTGEYADYLKFPDMERTEFGKEKDKEKRVQINRGAEGWTVTPSNKSKGDPEVVKLDAEDAGKALKNFKTQFDYVIRFVVNTPRASLLSAGSEVVDSRRADVVEVRDGDKNLVRIFIDRDTRLPLKTQTRLTNESTVYDDAYANWHQFGGVMTPLMVVRYRDGVKTMEFRVQNAAYNPGFADSLFSPPVTKSK